MGQAYDSSAERSGETATSAALTAPTGTIGAGASVYTKYQSNRFEKYYEKAHSIEIHEPSKGFIKLDNEKAGGAVLLTKETKKAGKKSLVHEKKAVQGKKVRNVSTRVSRAASRGYKTLQRYGDGRQDAADIAGTGVKRAGYKAGKTTAKYGYKGAKKSVKLAYKAGRAVTRTAFAALRAIGTTIGSALGSALLPVAGIALAVIVLLMAAVSAFAFLGDDSIEGKEKARLLKEMNSGLPDVSAEDAQKIAWKVIASDYPDWDTDEEKECLTELWNHESGWNYKSVNSESAAYGIVQALPPEKMESVGDDWLENPETQIKWGLNYIKGRYGTPCGAWEFWQNPTIDVEGASEHWY
ncbi:MAG: transglycosylase SLT domain-containing protein [Actinomycetaceae bacterium]|nr:transglycosylase SLT domain-containing protein [Actinomycetaceae bacterium]